MGYFKVDLERTGGRGRDKDRGCGGDGRPRRYCGALPSATEGVVQGSEDVGNGEEGEGIAVLDRLHPGI